MPSDSSPQYLRPEAQPIFDWSRMTECQQEGLERLVGMLHEALARPDETPHPKMRWLFKETRTQLAFINGIRGTGKTSLMVTMAAAIDEPRQFVATDHGDDHSPRFKDLKKQIEELRDRIICVQPLEMEGLPDNTPLLAAILARVYRTAKEYGSAGSARGFLMDDPSDSREITYLRQYLHRVAQALDSNLASRKGQLDPEQFGEAVMQEEDQRLTLPSDLEEVLRKLAKGIVDESSSDPHNRHSQTEKPNQTRRLFLIPIDDIDLNPRRCLELLRLLRTFSPPRELFFLLMGQFEMVEAIVKLQMSADFGRIQKEGGSLLGVDEQELTRKLEEISTANVRKMIPPHNRIRLRDLTIKEVLDFYPLNVVKPSEGKLNPWHLRTLLDKTRLYTQRGSEARFRTLGELLHPGDANWDRVDQPDEQKEIRDLSWIDYCGLGIFQVPARRLADAWMQLKTLSSEHEKLAEQEVHRKGVGRKTLKLMEEMIERVIEADPHLLESQQNILKNGPTPNCIQFVEDYPTFLRDLEVLNSGVEVPMTSEDAVKGSSSTRPIVYRPRLRLRALKVESAIPLFEMPGPEAFSPAELDDSVPARPSAQKIETLQTRAALAVRHDLREFYAADTQTLADFAECTSQRPVVMSWVGPEGEVATFPWPIPPLPTFAEASRFLRRWHEVSEKFFGPGESQPTDDMTSQKPLNQLLQALLSIGGQTVSSSGVITPNQVAHLMLLWVWLSLEELEASVEPLLQLSQESDCLDKPDFGSRRDGPHGVHNVALKWIIDRTLQLRQRAINQGAGRTWGQIDKWLRRIARIVQPEFAGFVVANRAMGRIERLDRERKDAKTESLQDLYQNVFLILVHQRTQRLEPLWANGKFQLWREINSGRQPRRHWMLSLLPEPKPKSDSEISLALADTRNKVTAVSSDVADVRSDVADIRNEMRDEFDRQSIRNMLSQARSFAAGSPESAMRLIAEAEVQADRISKRKPGDAAVLRELADSIYGITEHLKLPEDREATLQKVVELRQRVFNLDPGNESVAVSLSISAVELAQHYLKQLAWDAAQTVLDDDLLRISELHVRIPESRGVQRRIRLVNAVLAETAIGQEHFAEAETYATESLKISRKLLAAHPKSPQAKRDLSVSLGRCIDVAMEQERWKEAETYANEDLKISRELLATSPESLQAKRDLSMSLYRCVDVAMEQERWKEAETYANEDLKISRELLAASPGSLQAKRDLSASLDRYVDVEMRLERWQDAETYANEDLKISRELLAASPGSLQAKRDLSASLDRCVNVAMQRERWKDAAIYADEDVKISRALFTALPHSPRVKRDLSFSLKKSQAIAAHNGDLLEAYDLAFESAELMATFARSMGPDAFKARTDLVELTVTLAEREIDLGRMEDAKDRLQKVLPEAERLAADARGRTDDRLSLARCLALRARVTGNSEEKVELQKRAWELFAAEQRRDIRFHLELRDVFEELRRIFDPDSKPLMT